MYLVMWKYRVRQGKEDEFESVYGSDGEWVGLFRKADGYHGTELLRDLSASLTYTTIDRWADRASHESFLLKYEAEYKELDARCEALTVSEQKVGMYLLVDE